MRSLALRGKRELEVFGCKFCGTQVGVIEPCAIARNEGICHTGDVRRGSGMLE